jgi:hypothetical protein
MGDHESPLRRSDPRSVVALAEVRGIATREGGAEQGPFLVWDISDHGLRLWLAHPAAPGETLKLTIGRPFVLILTTEVMWCRPGEDGNGYHVGLRVLDNLARLEALHRQLLGFLPSSPSPTAL